jgi:hypothetical protein
MIQYFFFFFHLFSLSLSLIYFPFQMIESSYLGVWVLFLSLFSLWLYAFCISKPIDSFQRTRFSLYLYSLVWRVPILLIFLSLLLLQRIYFFATAPFCNFFFEVSVLVWIHLLYSVIFGVLFWACLFLAFWIFNPNLIHDQHNSFRCRMQRRKTWLKTLMRLVCIFVFTFCAYYFLHTIENI